MIPADHLRALRNDIPVLHVILDLRLPLRWRGSRMTFRCPGCAKFHTALHHRSNLASCFLCRKSINTIDLIMAERGTSFLEAVHHLERLLHSD